MSNAMRAGRMLLMAAAMVAAPVLAADDECTYDQSAQLEKLRKVAAGKANARVDADKRQLTWTGKDQTRWTLVYGGCAHLGFTVTASHIRERPAKLGEVLQAAVRMASDFWDPADSQELRSAVTDGRFEKRTDGALTRLIISREDYDKFEIEHEFVKPRQHITVRWLRSF